MGSASPTNGRKEAAARRPSPHLFSANFKEWPCLAVQTGLQNPGRARCCFSELVAEPVSEPASREGVYPEARWHLLLKAAPSKLWARFLTYGTRSWTSWSQEPSFCIRRVMASIHPTSYMNQVLPWICALCEKSVQPHEVANIIIPILQMRKEIQRDVKYICLRSCSW